MFKNYRKLKIKKITELVKTDNGLLYRRKKFNSDTGDELPGVREDVIDVEDLKNKVAKMQDEISNLEELITDLEKL